MQILLSYQLAAFLHGLLKLPNDNNIIKICMYICCCINDLTNPIGCNLISVPLLTNAFGRDLISVCGLTDPLGHRLVSALVLTSHLECHLILLILLCLAKPFFNIPRLFLFSQRYFIHTGIEIEQKVILGYQYSIKILVYIYRLILVYALTHVH